MFFTMTSPTFPIETIERDGAAILRPAGELDICTRESLVAACRRATRRRPARVVIDGSHIEFVDVAGVRALLECRGAARAAGARFALVHPSPAVVHALRLLRLDDVLAPARGAGPRGVRRRRGASRPRALARR